MAKIKSASLAEDNNGQKVIKIICPYDIPTIDQIRSLPGRKWHPDYQVWSAPLHVATLQKLIEFGFILDEKLQNFIQKSKQKSAEISLNGIEGMKGLYPFQKEGVAFIDSNNGRALISDEQGLGKTIQAIGYLNLHSDISPVVIVCPASLKLNWQNELQKWMKKPKIQILSGEKTYPIKADIVIINYDILHYWLYAIKKFNPKIVIYDEIHMLKNSRAKRTKVGKQLAKTLKHVIALSGTPVINRPIELYTAINIVAPHLYPNFKYFTERYCAPKFNGFGMDYSGCSHIDELHQTLVTTCMLRRLKKDVLKDLPDKTFSFVPMELNNIREYREAESDFINFVRKQKGVEAAMRAKNAEMVTKIETLKQVAVNGKLKNCIEFIEDFIDTDEKLVVFATHKFTIDALMQKFGKVAVKIDGSTSMTDRQKAVDDFQTKNEIKLFVGNIQAAGVGITLTAASNVAFLELAWSPSVMDQAQDRCHRIGQKNAVTVYYLLAQNTIEEKIADLLDRKRHIVSNILDGTEAEKESLLSEIINQYKD